MGSEDNVPSLKSMLSKGFLPADLPPTFSSKSFAEKAAEWTTEPYKKETSPVNYRLSRHASTPRNLQIVNPESYIPLSKLICDSWTDLLAHLSSDATILSRPSSGETERAISRAYKFSSHKYIKLNRRLGGEYVVFADVSKFYPSIYTHALAWCMDGKVCAKTKKYRRDKNILANKLDLLARNCTAGETSGIPIGPDSSYLLGEIIMSYIDKELHLQGFTAYTRNTDDFEFVAKDRNEADQFVACLASVLSHVKLELNPEKTKVVSLPAPYEDEWVEKIVSYNLSSESKTEKIVHFYDFITRLSREYSNAPVHKFALSYLLNNIVIESEMPPTKKIPSNINANTLLKLSLQMASYEVNCLKHCMKIIGYCENADFIDYVAVQSTLEGIIRKHAPLNHSSEVCWALWALDQMPLVNTENPLSPAQLSDKTIESLLLSQDCCVMTMALFLNEKNGILRGEIPTDHTWHQILSKPEEYDDYWLFWYEGITRQWLNAPTAIPNKYAVLRRASDEQISFLT